MFQFSDLAVSQRSGSMLAEALQPPRTTHRGLRQHCEKALTKLQPKSVSLALVLSPVAGNKSSPLPPLHSSAHLKADVMSFLL